MRKSDETQYDVFIGAIYLILAALLSLFAPALLSMAGDVDAGQAFALKISSVSMLSLAVHAWLVRNAGASKTRSAVVPGFTILFARRAATSLYGQFALPAPQNHGAWMQAVIQGLIAVGFFPGRTGQHFGKTS